MTYEGNYKGGKGHGASTELPEVPGRGSGPVAAQAPLPYRRVHKASAQDQSKENLHCQPLQVPGHVLISTSLCLCLHQDVVCALLMSFNCFHPQIFYLKISCLHPRITTNQKRETVDEGKFVWQLCGC